MHRPFVINALRLMLAVLLLSVSACSTPSVAPPQSVICPAPPPMPALSQPIPSETYSNRVRLKFKNWQELLIGTSPTSKP